MERKRSTVAVVTGAGGGIGSAICARLAREGVVIAAWDADPQAAQPVVDRLTGAVYQVEVARTPEAQAQGLMFRESLPANAGMLFLFPEGGVHKFWMKNTMIPLEREIGRASCRERV